MLTDQQVRHLISEIISGRRLFHLKCKQLESIILVFAMPSHQNKLQADIEYEATMLRAAYAGIPTRDQMAALVRDYGILDPLDNRRLEQIDDSMRTIKLMRSRTRSETQRRELDHRIRVLESIAATIKDRQEAYFFHTAEAKAEQAKTMYLIAKCVQYMDGVPFWTDVDNFKTDARGQVQNIIIKEYLQYAKGLDTKTIRYIARHYEWRIYWKSCTKTGGALFHGPTTDWDANKLLLCYWSDFYDNLYNHPKFPGDAVINDDDRCDQWVEDELRGMNATPGVSETRRDGYVTVKHDVSEPYRLVTAEEYAKEQAEKERMQR